MSFITLAIALFVVMNPFGSLPIIMQQVADYDPKTQIKVLTREMLIACVAILVFGWVGKYFLHFMGISLADLELTGGVILFIMGLHILFPDSSGTSSYTEPFIVPIAFPLVAGPGALTISMTHAHGLSATLLSIEFLCAIVLNCVLVWLIFISGPFISRLLGEKGLIALKKLGSVIILLIATQMIVNGIKTFNL